MVEWAELALLLRFNCLSAVSAILYEGIAGGRGDSLKFKSTDGLREWPVDPDIGGKVFAPLCMANLGIMVEWNMAGLFFRGA